MTKYFRKYQKQILAIFSVGLMIAWAIPDTYQRIASSAPVIGTINDDVKVYLDDEQRARQDWDTLSRTVLYDRQRSPYPFVATAYLGQRAMEDLGRHPEMFVLLLKEAQQMGVTVSQDRVKGFLANNVPPRFQQPQRGDVARAIGSLLLVEAAANRASSVVKVTQPLLKNQLATNEQTIRVNLVEFPAGAFKDQIPAPTTAQINEQFAKYDKVDPDAVDPNNPHGFGYRYPNRVKLQYVSILRSEVEKAIEKSKPEYEWEVEAQKYYYKNQAEYTSEPTSQPTTATSQASTQPIVKPFKDVRKTILENLMRPLVDQRIADIQGRIVSRMAADWAAYQKAMGPSTQPTTGPITSLGVSYDKADYLKNLALDIQKEYTALPLVTSLSNEWKTAKDLETLNDINKAKLGQVDFPTYATQMAEAFVPPAMKNESAVISVLEPSAPLRNPKGDVYVFRLTDADPAHKPAKVDEVIAQVQADVRTKLAYEKAVAAAKEILDAAKNTDLSSAAKAASRVMVTTGKFGNDPRPDQETRKLMYSEIPGYNIDQESRRAFIPEAFKLLTQLASTKNTGQPIAMIEMQRQNKVVIAELTGVETNWHEDSQFEVATQFSARYSGRLEMEFQNIWFRYDSVTNRLRYKPIKVEQEAPREPVAPTPPLGT